MIVIYCVLGHGIESMLAQDSQFFFLLSSSSPVYFKRGFSTRGPIRSDLALYSMKFTDFYMVLIGFENQGEGIDLFCTFICQSQT